MNIFVVLGVLHEFLILLRIKQLLRLGVNLLEERRALVGVHHAVQKPDASGIDPRIPFRILNKLNVAHDVSRIRIPPFGNSLRHLCDEIGKHMPVLLRLEHVHSLGAKLGKAVIDRIRAQQELGLLGTAGENRNVRLDLGLEVRNELIGVLLGAVIAHKCRAVFGQQLLVFIKRQFLVALHHRFLHFIDMAHKALHLNGGLLRLIDHWLHLVGGDTDFCELLLYNIKLRVNRLGVGTDVRIGLNPCNRIVIG